MFEIDKERFGAFLLELRKEKGYTQKQLAEKLFVSDKAVSKWERGVESAGYYTPGPAGGDSGCNGDRAFAGSAH